MTCPKCQGSMRQYERNGLTIDQCTGCRGLFLDRGELERLIDAEAAFHRSEPPSGQPSTPPSAPPSAPPAAPPSAPPSAPPPAAPPPAPAPAQPPAPGYGYPQSGYGHHGYRKKKRRSFLEGLFDD